MTFISANGTLVEAYQVEALQKAVASDLESETKEVSVEELLEQPEVNNGTSEVGNDSKNREKTKS